MIFMALFVIKFIINVLNLVNGNYGNLTFGYQDTPLGGGVFKFCD